MLFHVFFPCVLHVVFHCVFHVCSSFSYLFHVFLVRVCFMFVHFLFMLFHNVFS